MIKEQEEYIIVVDPCCFYNRYGFYINYVRRQKIKKNNNNIVWKLQHKYTVIHYNFLLTKHNRKYTSG